MLRFFCFIDIEGTMFRVFRPWLAAGVGFRGSLASFMAVALPPALLVLLLRGEVLQRLDCCSLPDPGPAYSVAGVVPGTGGRR